MLRVFSGIIFFVASVGIVIWLLGFFQPREYSGDLKEFFVDRRQIVWQSLTNINLIPKTKRDIQSVEILEENFGLFTWRENTKKGGYRIYKIIEKKEPFKYTVELLESSVGLTGTWTYFLENSSGGSIVTIQEESKNNNIWIRGIDVIRGRDVNLKYYMKVLRVALFRRLIDLP